MKSATSTPFSARVERFVSLYSWYTDFSRREDRHSAEIDRRFKAATGVTADDWRKMDRGDPRRKELEAVFDGLCHKVFGGGKDAECNSMCDQLWEAATDLMDSEPQTVADVAWQSMAHLLMSSIDSNGAPDGSDESVIRLYERLRLFQPERQPRLRAA